MKKSITTIAIVCFMAMLLTIPAIAADFTDEQAQELTKASIIDLSDPNMMYPYDIYTDMENREIRKVYLLKPLEQPGNIDVGGFERDGYYFECTDILRRELEGVESREYSETYTTDSSSNDINKVLSILPQTKEVATEDGLSGILTLDTESINIEVSGYGSSSRNVTATRSYPNLADADLAYIPKTTEDNGRTLELADVQWQTTTNAEGAERYTATASYGATVSSSYVKGYTVTVNYVGEISKADIANVMYTVVFTGTEIPASEPEAVLEPTPQPTTIIIPSPEPEPESEKIAGTPVIYFLVPLVLIALLGGAVAGYFILKKKGRNRNEEIHNIEKNSGGGDSDDTDDDTNYPGLGG